VKRRGPTVWPKRLPVLTDEQNAIRDDFLRIWLDRLPKKYRLLEWFDHWYPSRSAVRGGRTLEVGIGIGTQLRYEPLDQQYSAIDLREQMVATVRSRYPHIDARTADAQEELPWDDATFDRVLAIHCLEHMPNLPAALDEISRVMKPGGRLSVCIPCEGGLLHRFAREISARPLFEKRYGTSYDWLVATEHCNLPHEVMEELDKRFTTTNRTWFPFLVPSVAANLVIGLSLTKPAAPAAPAPLEADQA
jgi:ubiquinone/menaquinone biosynthesis C-methylase UbiE